MTALPEDEIREVLKRLTARHFKNETFYRNVTSTIHTKYKVHPLDTKHSTETGGRYNFKGTFHAGYLSHHATLATYEVEKGRHRLALPSPPKVDPDDCRLSISVTVTGPFLDLTNTAVIDALPGVTLDLLTVPTPEWEGIQETGQEAPTQVIGRLVHEFGHFGGIYFPAAEAKFLKAVFPKPNNIAVFMDATDPKHPEHPDVLLEIDDPNHFLADLGLL